MSSSKVWRKGRWFWSCTSQNRTLDWKDHEKCGAQSRLTYSSKEEANKAGSSHSYRTGHLVLLTQI